MNQHIQFSDLEFWDEQRQAVMFPALVGGITIYCMINIEKLRKLAKDKDSDPIALLRRMRWDLEEQAEAKLDAGDYNADGEIWLSGEER